MKKLMPILMPSNSLLLLINQVFKLNGNYLFYQILILLLIIIFLLTLILILLRQSWKSKLIRTKIFSVKSLIVSFLELKIFLPKKEEKKMSVALSIINTKSLQTIEDSTCSKNDKIQAEYQWARQYQLRFVPDDSQRMVLFIHENHATYLTEGVDKRIECDRCRMPEAARLDNEIRHHTWNGQTSILYHNTSAFTARERNQKREKRRIYNHNVSEDEDDEDILDPAITDGQQEMNNNNNNEKKDHQPQDDDEMDLDDSFEQKHVTNYEQLPPTALPNQKQSSVAEADIFGDDEEDDAAKVTEKQRQPTSTAMETDIFGDDDSDEDQVADKNKEQTNKETAAMDDLFGGDDSDDDL
mmetsp:Transcript_5872/g.7575  ORF Transcript_5872/g.7575 Transcript_5872/m.7575 type:complete len:355 (-) Transcript_5872:159-1223(-)